MRTEKMRLDNIEKVYRATVRLFEKHNVMNTTLQMIANEAGVSTRSIVNYFKTRENLLLAVHQRYVDSDARSGKAERPRILSCQIFHLP